MMSCKNIDDGHLVFRQSVETQFQTESPPNPAFYPNMFRAQDDVDESETHVILTLIFLDFVEIRCM